MIIIDEPQYREAGLSSSLLFHIYEFDLADITIQGIQGISKIKDGYNPATWMLEVTTTSQEQVLGVDFSDLYKKSELYQ